MPRRSINWVLISEHPTETEARSAMFHHYATLNPLPAGEIAGLKKTGDGAIYRCSQCIIHHQFREGFAYRVKARDQKYTLEFDQVKDAADLKHHPDCKLKARRAKATPKTKQILRDAMDQGKSAYATWADLPAAARMGGLDQARVQQQFDAMRRTTSASQIPDAADIHDLCAELNRDYPLCESKLVVPEDNDGNWVLVTYSATLHRLVASNLQLDHTFPWGPAPPDDDQPPPLLGPDAMPE